MLTRTQIEENKNRFLQLITEIDIPGADIEGLKHYVLNSDFFTAPASTMYHCNFEGGLCCHTLNVIDKLFDLTNMYAPGKYTRGTIIAIGAGHDFDKIDHYEKYIMNKKIYNENGTKHDNQGKFDWFAEEAFKVKDAKDRFIGGEHGFNSMIIVNKYIPMTYEETLAILHHHAGLGEAKQLYDLSAIMNKYPLVALLHSADFLATFITEAE